MVTLLYHSSNVGPVCQRVAAQFPKSLQVVSDKKEVPKYGTIVRWGSVWPGESRNEINTVAAVALAKDKGASRDGLGNLAPYTWFTREDGQMTLPCVVRPQNHHAAKKFFVCHDTTKFSRAIKSCGTGWYASELIEKSREFRVFVLHNHVLAVSERFPANPGDIAWNLAVGGRLINVRKEEWPLPVLMAALEAAKRLCLDWTAIDIALNMKGVPFVFEANTAPGLRNPYTISQIAKGLRYSDTHTPPQRAGDKTWKQLLHPALRRSPK